MELFIEAPIGSGCTGDAEPPALVRVHEAVGEAPPRERVAVPVAEGEPPPRVPLGVPLVLDVGDLDADGARDTLTDRDAERDDERDGERDRLTDGDEQKTIGTV